MPSSSLHQTTFITKWPILQPSKGLNVLVAKPIVKTVEEHDSLIEISREKKSIIAMEVHKRWDPIYSDAREKMRDLGEFSYFSSYMSQPKSQLDSFRDWAGKSSDISYYLNTHHIDFHCWALDGLARPISVIASASTGVATSQGLPTEDSITLMVDWLNNSWKQSHCGLYLLLDCGES
jgi:D-galacturonate reductase